MLQSKSLNGNLWLTGAVTQEAFGYIGLAILAIAIIMGIFTGLNGFLMSSSRLLFSMGRAGIMPTVFSKLHPRFKTPYVAIIFLYEGIDNDAGEPGINNKHKNINETIVPKIAKVL